MTKDTPDDRSLQDVLKLEGLSRAHGTAIAVRRYASVGLLVLFGTVLAGQSNPAMPPEAERQLAREIYKEMVEIKSGYTTGATTPVAEAAARRLKAAGFPDADVFVGGAIPTKANLVVRYRGTGRAPSASAARAHRRGGSQARRLDAWIRSRSPSATAISTAAAPATTRPRPRSGSPTSFATSVKASSRTATSSSRSRPTKRAAARTTASRGC